MWQGPCLSFSLWDMRDEKRVPDISRRDQESSGLIQRKCLGGEQVCVLRDWGCNPYATVTQQQTLVKEVAPLEPPLWYFKTKGFGAAALSFYVICSWALHPSLWLKFAPSFLVQTKLGHPQCSGLKSRRINYFNFLFIWLFHLFLLKYAPHVQLVGMWQEIAGKLLARFGVLG